MPMRAGRASPCTTAAPPLRATGTRRETNARLKLERLARFECGLLGGMHRWYVHAAVKTAVEKEQRRGRGACIEVFHGVQKEMRNILFLQDPLNKAVPYTGTARLRLYGTEARGPSSELVTVLFQRSSHPGAHIDGRGSRAYLDASESGVYWGQEDGLLAAKPRCARARGGSFYVSKEGRGTRARCSPMMRTPSEPPRAEGNGILLLFPSHPPYLASCTTAGNKTPGGDSASPGGRGFYRFTI